jgi:hypothetical protein
MTRIIGWVLALAGLGALIADLTAAGSGGLRFHAVGEWWFRLSPGSLQLAQPAIERHVAPFLWDPVILTVLEAPAALAGLGAGAALIGVSLVRRRSARSSRETGTPRSR